MRVLILILLVSLDYCMCAPIGEKSGATEVEDELQMPSKPLKLVRPNHIDDLPIERDGDLNKDFRQEVLLGDVSESSDLKKEIEDMFVRSDKNGDQLLSADELIAEMKNNTEHHIQESQQEAKKLLKEIDANSDGLVSWPEYRIRFVLDQHIKVNDRMEPADEDSRSELEEEHIAFGRNDVDHSTFLDETEWIGFLHPELSLEAIHELAADILKSFDKDGDNFISKSEFTFSQPMVIEGEYKHLEKDDTKKREEEFERDIDTNGDGLVTLDELINYVNPRNEARFVKEATELLELCDNDGDLHLSLKELLSKDIFLERSSLLSASRRLHEDL